VSGGAPARSGAVQVERTIAGVRAALAQPRRASARIGLVPTMGAFHEGHLSLMRRAREQCDTVVVSLFVNAPQFGEASDLASYPRDEQRDLALAAKVGVDLVFAPSEREMYPEGFATTVSVAGLTERLEGAARGRAHFDAVATVVTKLLNIVGPDVAYFGAKDAQQARVIDRLARDLDMPVAIEVCPTVRESDGLAMSSRNARLSAAEREQASALHRALRIAADCVAAGERDPHEVVAAARAELDRAGVRPEYLELVHSQTLEPLARVDGSALALLAARIGETRLIDNQRLSTISMAGSSRTERE
jgi:pantoate--beta-alanine ligase